MTTESATIVTMREIPLTQGKVAIVDVDDYQRLKQFKWHASKRPNSIWYAVRNSYVNGTRSVVYMHQDVISAARIDHRDGNGLNNRRSNLRVCTQSKNIANARHHRDNTSGFKGVSYHKQHRLWQAGIGVNGKRIGLGWFSDAEKAARAYDAAALKYFGEFAKINFPPSAA